MATKIVQKIVLSGLTLGIAGIICPAAQSSVISLQALDSSALLESRMTEADFISLSDDQQKRMLNELLELNRGNKSKAFLDAVEKRYLWAIQPLIKKGVHRASYEVGEALRIAAKNDDVEMVKLLLAHGSKSVNKSTRGRAALGIAIQNDNLAIIEALLAAGADPNTVDKDGTTVLMVAVRKGWIEKVEALLAEGVDPNTADQYGTTALMLAARNGHTQTVKSLLAHGVNSWNSGISLIGAAANGYIEIVELLLAAGVNPDAIDEEGDTALMVAASNSQNDVVKRLLDARANPDIFNKKGRTALHYADESNHAEIVELLLATQASKNIDIYYSSALSLAVKHGHIQKVKELLTAGANPNFDTSHNVLGLAVSKGHTEILKLLLAAQASVDSVDRFNGSTALIRAAKCQGVEMAKELIAAGANLDIVDTYGRTAMFYTMAGRIFFSPIVPLFIDAYRQRLTRESRALIQQINDSQTHLQAPSFELNSGVKSAFEQLFASHHAMLTGLVIGVR